MKSKRIRRAIFFSVSILLAWIIGGYIFVYALTCSAHKDYPAIQQIAGFPAQQKSISSTDNLKINAWLAGNNKDSVVILIAGIRGNSTYMIDRAKIYLANGFSVLLPDLRATGKSDGDVISFGWNEKHDLLACVRWLKNNGYSTIAVHGCSLGAATIAYSFDSTTDYRFVVMESCYDNIDHALANRAFDSGFNRFLFWPVYFFADTKIKVSADDLSPINRVSKYKGPLLYFSGDKEKQIPIDEAKAIFSEFGSTQKTLHIFKGASHIDFLPFQPEVFKTTLTDFLHSMQESK